jgi:cytoskeletal protein CcmA (bactofilin family)
MARTTFTGPVKSNNGFEGDIAGNLVSATTLVIGGSTTITAGVATGSVSAQVGYIPVKIGSTTKYIALYSSLTP